MLRKRPADNTEMSLAERVEALERYIREQEQVRTAAAQEEALPEGQSEPPKDTCKELEPIIKPTFTPLGRIYVDGVSFDDDDETAEFFNTDRENEFGLRTFRIGGQGYVWENVFYTLEFELRGGPNSITYKDIYIEQQNIPGIGRFRAGHFKEPLGLEEFGSDRFNTFMEKSPATQAFTPSRNFGVMIWNNIDPCQELTWFTGLFRADSPDAPNNSGLWRSDNNDWSYDARLAWLPFYDEPSKGRYLTHLGGSYSYRHIGGRTAGATLQSKRRVQHAQRPGRILQAIVGRHTRPARLRRRSRHRRVESAQWRVPRHLGIRQRPSRVLSAAHDQRRDLPGRLRVWQLFSHRRKPPVPQGKQDNRSHDPL